MIIAVFIFIYANGYTHVPVNATDPDYALGRMYRMAIIVRSSLFSASPTKRCTAPS